MGEVPTAGEAQAAMLAGFRGEPDPGLTIRVTGNRLLIEGDPATLASIVGQLTARAASAGVPVRVLD